MISLFNIVFKILTSIMTYPKKELNVACSYLLRLIKTRVELSPEQINVFKRTFHEIVSRRFIGHWFPGKNII